MKRGLCMFLALFIFSCGENLIEKPKDLIPKETMVDILRDLTIISSAKNTNPVVLRNKKIDPTSFVFSKYGVDSLQFVASDKYYASLPNEYEAIYAVIEEQLQNRKDQIVEEKRIKDSLDLKNKVAKKPISKEKDTEAIDSLQ